MNASDPLLKKFEKECNENTPWDGDVLSRKILADYLTIFINSITQPFVISVDAPYGGGKTFFLKSWHHALKKDGYRTVYFNAWESDFTADPLAAFMASISSQIPEFSKGGASRAGKPAISWKKTEKLSAALIRGGVSLGIGVADSGLFDGEIFKKIIEFSKTLVEILKGLLEFLKGLKDTAKKETEKSTTDIPPNTSDNLIKSFQKQQDGLTEFQNSLTETIKALTEGLPTEKQKLIIFVDELDRCRPTYAVEVLERIKHLFCVPGAVFILGMNEKQMANSMSAIFGNKLDTDGYLRRFIDWRYRLPEPSNMGYSKFLFQQFDLASLSQFSTNNIKGRISELIPAHGIFAEALGLTLRQQEQCYTEFNLCLRTLMPDDPAFSATLGMIGTLRINDSDRLNEALSSEEGRDALHTYLSERIDFRGQTVLGLDDWKSFSPIFRTWFYGPRDREFIQGKLDHEFWRKCADAHNRIYHKSGLTIEMSLAQIVVNRLDRTDSFPSRVVR